MMRVHASLSEYFSFWNTQRSSMGKKKLEEKLEFLEYYTLPCYLNFLCIIFAT
jgi:hypothetical protein